VAAGNPTETQIQLVSAVSRYNAQLRTTCVATLLQGGHAANALPQTAKATVNCRLLPGEKADFVLGELQKVAGDRVKVTAFTSSFGASEPADINSPVMKTIQRVSESMWPGVPVVPTMSTGATDGSRLRNAEIPVYGVSGIFVESGENRLHGRDERLGVKAFFESSEYLYRLVKALGSGE
jgi:acetylornithine deacetylase/succinyl-diaminopimelate desuccinylase-like protein